LPSRPQTAKKLAASEASDRLAAFSIFDESNPMSVVNMVPPMVAEAIRKIPQQCAYVTHATEGQIKAYCKPDERDERLRLAFWDEYNYATSVSAPMRINYVIRGLCSGEVFYNYYLSEPKKLAWVLTPPKFYSQGMKYILHLGLDRLTEIMQAKVVDDDGKLDVRAAATILKAFQLVDLRVKGAIMQKVQIDQRTLNMNADVHAEQLHQLQLKQLQSMSASELDDLERRAQIAEKAAQSFERNIPVDQRQEVIDLVTDNDMNTLRGSAVAGLPRDDELSEVVND
jgi:hypothetical protein